VLRILARRAFRSVFGVSVKTGREPVVHVLMELRYLL